MPSQFVPAASKLEAVQRISRLTGSGPEVLGRGSKERKSVLLNLARGLGLPLDAVLAKPQLGRALAQQLGARWDDTCWSTGSTITLSGLNTLLEAAEARLGLLATLPAVVPEVDEEVARILQVIAEEMPGPLDGRSCITEMRDSEFSQWAQDEWVGFYFEFRAIPSLIAQLGGGPIRVLNTTFDYRLRTVWDLKAHSETRGDAPLNDQEAMRRCVQAGMGLGLLVLSGEPIFDDGEFREWQKALRLDAGRKPTPRVRRDDRLPTKRRYKAAFLPRRVDAYRFADEHDLDEAERDGVLRTFAQGQQQGGAPRRPKYSISLGRANRYLIDSVALGQYESSRSLTVDSGGRTGISTPPASNQEAYGPEAGSSPGAVCRVALWAERKGRVAVWQVGLQPGSAYVTGGWEFHESDPRLSIVLSDSLPVSVDSVVRPRGFLGGRCGVSITELVNSLAEAPQLRTAEPQPVNGLPEPVASVLGAARWLAAVAARPGNSSICEWVRRRA